MESFKDSAGRQWQLTINVAAIRRVREQTGFEFGTCLEEDGQAFFAMLNNLELLPAVLWELVRGQAQDAGVTQDQFFDAFNGEVFDDAAPALQRAFAFFCPTPYRQAMLNMMEMDPIDASTGNGKASSSRQELDVTREPTAIES